MFMNNKVKMDNSNLFNKYYYENEFDPPYRRDEYWLDLFESMAKVIVREIKPGTVLDAGCAMGFLGRSAAQIESKCLWC